MYVCMYVCMYAYMYVCMYACMCVYMYACMYSCMYDCICVFTTCIMCQCARVCVRMPNSHHICTCVCVRSYVHISLLTYLRANAYACDSYHTHQAHMQTYTHNITYIIYIYIYISRIPLFEQHIQASSYMHIRSKRAPKCSNLTCLSLSLKK